MSCDGLAFPALRALDLTRALAAPLGTLAALPELRQLRCGECGVKGRLAELPAALEELDCAGNHTSRCFYDPGRGEGGRRFVFVSKQIFGTKG